MRSTWGALKILEAQASPLQPCKSDLTGLRWGMVRTSVLVKTLQEIFTCNWSWNQQSAPSQLQGAQSQRPGTLSQLSSWVRLQVAKEHRSSGSMQLYFLYSQRAETHFQWLSLQKRRNTPATRVSLNTTYQTPVAEDARAPQGLNSHWQGPEFSNRQGMHRVQSSEMLDACYEQNE